MACADQFNVIFEARRNGLGPMGVALDKLDDLLFFLLFSPYVECFQVLEDQGVAIIHVTRPIRASLSAPRGGILNSISGDGGGSDSGGRGRGGDSGRGRIRRRLCGLIGNTVETEILKTHLIFCPTRDSNPARLHALLLFGPQFAAPVTVTPPTNSQNTAIWSSMFA